MHYPQMTSLAHLLWYNFITYSNYIIMSKKISIILGVLFILFGILGMIGTGIVGANGFFLTDTIHNIIHLLSGVIFLIVAYVSVKNVAITMKIFGILYLLLAILGFISLPILGFINANSADNWLHVVLGIVLFAIGWWLENKEIVLL